MYLRGLIFFVVVGFLTEVGTVQAASLYITPNNAEISRGDTIAVAVRLDTDEATNECVNVIDATIKYSENIEPVDTTRGNSILSVWLEEPVINKADRTITFAGGIPNGYCGRIQGDPRLTNVVVELLFRSPGMLVGAVNDLDAATIEFAPETRALLNDGFGTEAQLATYGTTINLLKSVANTISNEWSDRIAADDIPPEEFSIELVRTPNAFSNKYVIVFSTTDKQSGIDHYEVLEEPLDELEFFRWGAETAPWVTARSPYELEDQSLNSTIRVRAIDKAGNEYVATLVPDESQRSMSLQSKLLVALVGAAVGGFVLVGALTFILMRRRKDFDDVYDDENEIEDEDLKNDAALNSYDERR